MSTAQITTTPTPLALVDKINEIITNYLPNDGTAESAKALEGLTATIAELNKLDGVTATTQELNYVDGVTSNIQTQLNGKLSTSGTAAKATADASGNNIASTYATKATAITGLSASGKTVTYTKGDGSTGTITTQDTVYSLPTASSSTLGGVKVGSGLSISSGVLSASGSIVASSLGTNGYVKFGNGLILQWGYHGSMTQETTALITLNINYTSNGYYADCNTSSSNPSNRGIITAQPYSVSQIKLINGNANISDVRWWTIGKQQWGYSSNSTYTFPITFTTTTYTFVNQFNLNFAEAHYERNNYVSSKLTTSITLGTSALMRFWIAIGT